MNDFLELVSSAGTAGWLSLCVVGAVAVGLFAYDRRRNRSAPGLTVVPGLKSGRMGRVGDGVNDSDLDADSAAAKSA